MRDGRTTNDALGRGRLTPLLLLGLLAAACGGSSSAHSGTGDAPPPAEEPVSCEQRTGETGTFLMMIESGGLEREFRLIVPESVDLSAPVPLVLNFHGLGSNAQEQELYAAMAEKARSAGFLTAAGEGTNHSWNAGETCCPPANRDPMVDDVQFVRDMVAAISSDYCVDPKRIYATGMSNGGFFSNRLACDAADLIAAVAPVAGFLGLRDCAPARPIPILMFNGTDDFLVPYGAAQSSFAGWAERNGCRDEPQSTFSSDDVHCEAHLDCDQGATTTFCTVEGGGHTWPGAVSIPALGATTSTIDATDAMWDFFASHPLP